MTDFADLLEPVARRLLGEPNRKLSNDRELRFGANGSLKANIAGPKKGTWYSHEDQSGGGVLDLIIQEKGGDRKAAVEWLQAEIGNAPTDTGSGKDLRIAMTYDYESPDGQLLYQVVRMQPKQFRQRRPDDNGGWHWNIKGVSPVPYRLPELIEDITQDRTVYIVEGEKDVDSLRDLTIPATCNSGGAGKWRDAYCEHFEGADVVILPDNDQAGRDHAESVARSLKKHAARIRLLHLPGLSRKGDVSEWLSAGGTVDQLHALVDAAPDWCQSTTHFRGIWFGQEHTLEPLSWLIQETISANGFGVVYGAAGCGKSFFTLDLGLCLAFGRMWFNKRVRRHGVAYIAAEGGRGVGLRMEAWRRQLGEGDKAPFVLVPDAMDLRTPDSDVAHLVDDLQAWSEQMDAPLGLIIIDTLTRVMAGGDDADMRDVSSFIRNIERIQEATNATVLVVHHQGKDPGRGMRGHTALLAAADTVIKVTHEDGVRTAKIEKQKDGRDGQAYPFKLQQTALGRQDDFGQDVKSCVVVPSI